MLRSTEGFTFENVRFLKLKPNVLWFKLYKLARCNMLKAMVALERNEVLKAMELSTALKSIAFLRCWSQNCTVYHSQTKRPIRSFAHLCYITYAHAHMHTCTHIYIYIHIYIHIYIYVSQSVLEPVWVRAPASAYLWRNGMMDLWMWMHFHRPNLQA